MKYVTQILTAIAVIAIAFLVDWLLGFMDPRFMAVVFFGLLFIGLMVFTYLEVRGQPEYDDHPGDGSEVVFPKHWSAERKAAWKAANGNRVLPPNSQQAGL